MNRLIIFSFLFLNLACTTSNQPVSDVSHLDKFGSADELNMVGQESAADDPYDIELSVERSENNIYHLVAIVVPDSGSWFISPYSKQFFKGHFNISIEENDKLLMDDAMTESPGSVEENLPIEGLANVVRVKTVYQRKINIVAAENFEVMGVIRFVIEPKCTLEQIRFRVSHRSGKLEADFVGND